MDDKASEYIWDTTLFINDVKIALEKLNLRVSNLLDTSINLHKSSVTKKESQNKLINELASAAVEISVLSQRTAELSKKYNDLVQGEEESGKKRL